MKWLSINWWKYLFEVKSEYSSLGRMRMAYADGTISIRGRDY